jgi:hypothetical protein
MTALLTPFGLSPWGIPLSTVGPVVGGSRTGGPPALLPLVRPFGFSAIGVPLGLASPAPSLVASVVARLRSYAGGAVAAALGDSAATPKVWKDQALVSPALPWVRVEKPRGVREYTGLGNFIERGTLQLSVFAATSTQAQSLSDLVAKGEPGAAPGALDDPPLLFKGGRLMKFRLSRPSFEAASTPAAGSPVAYHRVLIFDYWFSGNIS